MRQSRRLLMTTRMRCRSGATPGKYVSTTDRSIQLKLACSAEYSEHVQ